MKKQILTLILSAFAAFSIAQSATDFTAEDCNGVSYNLFSELDAGKVVVICWTMPCGACIPGALTTYNIVQSYEANYPGIVKMYIVDDFGNTPCSSINTWSNSNGMTRAAKFSDAVIAMSDYGIAGMPKIVVIGPDHQVYYNVNNAVEPNDLQAAINAALTPTGLHDVATTISNFNLYPNPAAKSAQIKFNLAQTTDIAIHLLSLDGKLVQEVYRGRGVAGENQIPVDMTAYSNGMYWIRISDGDKSRMISLMINH
jgi:thiol-disulfide isomerase/thioredoxin